MTPRKPGRDSKAANPPTPSSPGAASEPADEGPDDDARDVDERTPEDDIQEGHSVLWSAYAGMPDYESYRFARRYAPFGDDRIADYLVRAWRRLTKEPNPDLQGPIGKGLVKLALWYFQPQFDRSEKRADALSDAFTESFGVNPAAGSPDKRPICRKFNLSVVAPAMRCAHAFGTNHLAPVSYPVSTDCHCCNSSCGSIPTVDCLR